VRSSDDIQPSDADEQYVWNFDQRQIDNANPNAFTRLTYLDRINCIVETIKALVPVGGRVADIGCAQGNIAIAVAESGYAVDAYDLNQSFLSYAMKKAEYGRVSWHHCDIFSESTEAKFDGIILGEIVEHVAHPDELLARATSFARLGGILIVTTPNGQYIRERLPSYHRVVARGDLARIEREQFGPGGEHHLFAYTLKELVAHVPSNAELVTVKYFGSGLLNSHVQRLLNSPRLGSTYRSLAHIATQIPGLRERLSISLVLVLRRIV
jgi:2-polyprenyl-6-hydroxyphenyl methylase/3-demethylubiquinone-9 3-methyltransferase